MADIVAGNALGSGVCACDDASYCARVAAGSFAVPAQVGGKPVGRLQRCPCLLGNDSSSPASVQLGPVFPSFWQGQPVLHAVGGELSPLPFQSLRNATDAQLKCFQGGLGQATDTYNVRG